MPAAQARAPLSEASPLAIRSATNGSAASSRFACSGVTRPVTSANAGAEREWEECASHEQPSQPRGQ